ncbi:MAG: DUF4012 domain-containing protein [Acidimicrobiales bacterium]
MTTYVRRVAERLHRRSPILRAATWIVGAVAVILLVLGLVAAWRLAGVYGDVDAAWGLLDEAGVQVERGALAEAGDGLAGASSRLVRANGVLHTAPELQILDWVPIVRQNLRSLRGSVGVALHLSDSGRRLLVAAQPLQDPAGDLEVPLRTGAIPLAVVADVAGAAAELASSLPGRSERPSRFVLLGPVADLQDRVYDEALGRRAQLDSLARALDLVADMSGGNGPRRYLIAVANTAEMRGTGGMILHYGVLEGVDGDFELGAFGPIDELLVDQGVDPASVGLPDDYLQRWQTLAPARLWRNSNLTADFTLAAPVMEALFTKATGLAVDGVIQIDPAGLGAILRGIGPVGVPPLGSVTAENVVALTLNDAYVRFLDVDVRREVLGDVAEAVFRKLVDGEYPSLRPIGEAVFASVAARHILFHTLHPGAQNHVRFFGADGELPSPETDSLLLTVQNISANKLDYYVDTSVVVRGVRPAGDFGLVTATITVANTAPQQAEPAYIFGPNTPALSVGLYRGVVSLYLPAGASLVASTGGPTVQAPALGSEDGRAVASFAVDVPAGGAATVSLELRLPPRSRARYTLAVVPAPRVRPTTVDIDLDTGDGVLRFAGPLIEEQVIGGSTTK